MLRNTSKTSRHLALYRLAVLMLTMSPALADSSGWHLGVGLGYGQRANPLIQSEDIPVVVDLDIAWFGERGFFDNGDAGYTFIDNDNVSLSIVGRINSDRLFFTNANTRFFSVTVSGGVVAACNPADPGCEEVDTRVDVPDRDYTIEGGIELIADGRWGHLQLAAYHDVIGVHEGLELLVSYARPWRFNRLVIEPSVSLSFRNSRRNDYYWGVTPDEAQLALPEYRAGSGTSVGLRLVASYQLTRQWAAVAVAQQERLPSSISASPLVADDRPFAWFAGFRYGF